MREKYIQMLHIATMKAVIALSSNFVPRYRGVEKLGRGGNLILRGTWRMKLLVIIFIAQTSNFSVLLLSCQLHETGDFWAGFHVTLNIVCSGFLIGIQFSM